MNTEEIASRLQSEPLPPPRRRRRHRLRLIALLLALLMVVPGISYAQALTYPGNASWADRSVGWVRDNGGAGIVNAVENWYYTLHAPSTGAPEASSLPSWAAPGRSPGQARGTDTHPAGMPTAIPPLAGATPLPSEGQWITARRGKNGAPALYTTILRPDVAHPSVVAAAAMMPAGQTSAHLVAGTREPGGTGWPGDAAIPVAALPQVVATFNSGWKYTDINGGFYQAGRSYPHLRDGLASVVIDRQGRVRIGQWGKDVWMGPNVVAVRQNLKMVIEHGSALPGLDSNAGGAWGSAKNQLQYTWRSGLGTDTAGNLIYVCGDNLTLKSLAAAMTKAGIDSGMELDIHRVDVNFAVWGPSTGGQPSATNLLPNTKASADRYVAPDQRDFFYLTLK
ncbi:hypothetical protein [Arthrobacter sp.]|uniref:hypothetical protein n=1 Tax=Arthrobacter sp. TaxID=1667 RepID=UPI003A8E285E